MSSKHQNKIFQNEISIKYIVDFLFESWVLILTMSFIGLLGGIVFAYANPGSYSAKAQIQLMQFNNNASTNPSGLNVEDVGSLISRFKLPTTIHAEELKACGIDKEGLSEKEMMNLIKMAPIQGSNSIIEMRITVKSKDLAVRCANALFERIRLSQIEMLKPFIQEASVLLSNYEQSLKLAKASMKNFDITKESANVGFLLVREDIRYYNEEISRLKAIIMGVHSRQTKLVSPIFIVDNNNNSFEKKIMSVLIGLFVGIFLGILFAMMRNFYRLSMNDS